MGCKGRNNKDHCCYIAGKPCPFLERNTEKGFRWSCGLRRELGSWDAVIADPRYHSGAGSPGEAFKNTAYVNCKNYLCPGCGGDENHCMVDP